MQIECGSCGRAFDLDERRVGDLTAARCVCGVQIQLRSSDGSVLPCRLGKYLLLSRIAAGGMGEIYFGKLAGAEGFERNVAIKKLLGHLSGDRDFIDMMVKEAKLTVLLNHPNIVQVHDLARDGDTYYIAMEYVPGITVGTLLDRIIERHQALPVEVAVYITSQLLRGLAYAHELPGPGGEPITILHRDITPQNIMVTRHGWVKITDFGIARALNEISTTSPGIIKGKLGYIAPEQLEGRDPDRRVDIFCAGIFLWEMLAAQRLFKGDSEAETFRKIAEAKVPSLLAQRPDVSEELNAVVQRSLARDRRARFSSADAFSDGLSHALFPQSVDDCRQATKTFLSQHTDLFDLAENPLRAVSGKAGWDAAAELPAAALADISALTASRRRFGAGWWAAWGFAVLAIVVGIGLISWPDARRAVQSWVEAGLMTTEPTTGVEPRPAPSALQAPAPSPLTTREIQAVVQRHATAISACLRGVDRQRAPPRLEAQITIGLAGRVSEVAFASSILDAALHACLESTLRTLRFREQPTDGFRITIPVEISLM